MPNLLDYGLLRANPDAQSTNNLKLAVCQPCTTTDPCLDYHESSASGSATVDSVTIDGVVYTLDGNTVSSLDWVAEIEDILANQGTNREINVYFKGNYEFGNISVEHIGRRTVSTLTLSTGAKSFTRQCSTAVFCSNQLLVEGSVTAISDGTTSENLATGTYNYTGTAATDALTAEQLKDDIVTALTNLSVSFFYVKVKVVTSEEKFKVTVRRQKDGTRLYIDSVILDENNCSKQFTAGAVNV